MILATTRFALRDNQRLSYEVLGKEDGCPLLALHDLLVDRGQLRPLAAALAETPPSGGGGLGGEQGPPSGGGGLGGEPGYRVLLPDARGHGASPSISSRSYPAAELAADALAVLDAERISNAQVVAVGWGAQIALALAARAPERIVSLALIAPYSPSLLAEHPNEDAQRYGAALQDAMAEAANAAGRGQTEPALDGYLGVRWGAGWRERVSKPRLAAIRRAAANLGPLLAGMTPDQGGQTALRSMAQPATFLLRDDAPVFERWTAEALSLVIPGSGVQTASIASLEEGQDIVSAEWATVLERVLKAQRG